MRQEEADRAYQANAATPHHHHVEENEEGEEDGEDETQHGDVTKELVTDANIIDPVEERRTLAEKSERLFDQLKVSDAIFQSPGTHLMRNVFFFTFAFSC